MMRKLKNVLRNIIFRYVKPPVFNNSNSQAGEDKITDYLFSSMGIHSITYIDIGASDPVSSNNTYFFYLKNNRGILVEPDAAFNEVIGRMRPEDRVINVAVGDGLEKEADFFIFNSPSLNTLSAEEAALRGKSGLNKLIDRKKIQLTTIEEIIEQQLQGKIPELISLDIEGMDFSVLSAFDFEKFPVPVWIVETCDYSENHLKPKVNTIIELMLSKGYFVFADTYINTIFVHERWFQHYNVN